MICGEWYIVGWFLIYRSRDEYEYEDEDEDEYEYEDEDEDDVLLWECMILLKRKEIIMS